MLAMRHVIGHDDAVSHIVGPVNNCRKSISVNFTGNEKTFLECHESYDIKQII
jgi:hypothetical protein